MPSANISLPPFNLALHRVGSLPSLYIIDDYVPPTLEQHLLTNIAASKGSWVQVKGRRLKQAGGSVSTKGVLIPGPMPSWLQPLVEEVSQRIDIFGDGSVTANHVLINEYPPGEGIFAHQDGPAYHPAVAILSLGSPAIIRFYPKVDQEHDGGDAANAAVLTGKTPLASVVMQPRCLLVFKDDAYESCLHGIDAVAEEALDCSVVNSGNAESEEKPATLPRGGTRVSLTIRRVLRVHRGLGLVKK